MAHFRAGNDKRLLVQELPKDNMLNLIKAATVSQKSELPFFLF
jgi:hypothetical protein